ncbi:MAG: hypothetical protein KAJ75_06185 [Alphaproteobacteria bacterium]|nr:hypothetical protein [Alphaproteobacteria bacterium]
MANRPPPCPEAGADVADDFLKLPDDACAAWDYLGRLKLFCDQIDRIRKG